ncbi:MAG: hypothetical protein GY725_12365 [bacterium]|nr:hypothetical protein [bacterium]
MVCKKITSSSARRVDKTGNRVLLLMSLILSTALGNACSYDTLSVETSGGTTHYSRSWVAHELIGRGRVGMEVEVLLTNSRLPVLFDLRKLFGLLSPSDMLGEGEFLVRVFNLSRHPIEMSDVRVAIDAIALSQSGPFEVAPGEHVEILLGNTPVGAYRIAFPIQLSAKLNGPTSRANSAARRRTREQHKEASWRLEQLLAGEITPHVYFAAAP